MDGWACGRTYMETGTGGAWNVHSYDELLSVRALPVYRPTTDYHRPTAFFFWPSREGRVQLARVLPDCRCCCCPWIVMVASPVKEEEGVTLVVPCLLLCLFSGGVFCSSAFVAVSFRGMTNQKAFLGRQGDKVSSKKGLPSRKLGWNKVHYSHDYISILWQVPMFYW